MNTATLLPEDHERAILIGRVFDPDCGGPCVVHLRDGKLADITRSFPTVSQLLDEGDPSWSAANASAERYFPLETVIANTFSEPQEGVHLLAPCDLQAIKACGVTFANSMLERVIEERAKGSSEQADRIRREVSDAVGGALTDIRAGSPEAQQAKAFLQKAGLWSQYLEVGIGPDAEVFTKAQALSAMGTGAEVGVLRTSNWNNPEPEVVLAVNSRGTVQGATLGNDVNLRDYEGRSALLLSKAKDNNASCAIGPFIRLFNAEFGMDDVRRMEIELSITGNDGFSLRGKSLMSQISRDPETLVGQTIGPSHQYPDGLMLFLGTLFAPTADRGEPGMGFTHIVGDVVGISTPQLGLLSNRVAYCDAISPWTFGVRALIDNLARRGLLI